MRVSRLWHTVRHLRAEQVVGQLGHHSWGRFDRTARWRRRSAPAFAGVAWRPSGTWIPPGPPREGSDALERGELTFLNRTERLGLPPATWEPAGPSLLWKYNLHYFEWLWPLPFEQGAAAARDWTERHPLAPGSTGWQPYPTSLRLENWCAYFFDRHRERTLADEELCAALWESVHLQAEWLAGNLERRLLGNHLLENVAALAFTGACFAGDAAERWFRVAERLLERELAEQVLPDGGHFERSPMYLARVVWLLRALDWTGEPRLRKLVSDPLARSRAALAQLCHPDGEIALLNDSAFCIANAPRQLELPSVAPGSFALPRTGYYGARHAGSYLVCDAAPVGPDYIPGHAHGDLLSFELSFAGHRVLVDAGVFDYEDTESRRYARSTAAHNTVEIEGEDQCEFWSAFRVARRGKPRDVCFEAKGDGFRLEAWHDGYARLAGAPTHRRVFRWDPRGVLLVRDRVDAGRSVTARTWLHLHPDCTVSLTGARSARIDAPGGACRVEFAGPGALAVEASRFFPEFGVERAAQALCFTSHGRSVATGFCVANDVETLRYDLEAGADVDGTRFGF